MSGRTTTFLAPFGPPATSGRHPALRVRCVDTGLRDDDPDGQFFARCLGTVQGWDRLSGQLIVNPLAIFRRRPPRHAGPRPVPRKSGRLRAMDEAPVWVVLARSIAHVVDEPAFVATVLDQGTGLMRGLSVGGDQDQALRAAMSKALTEPAAELPPARPGLVLCCGLEPARVRKQLATLLKPDVPPVHSEGIDEAEDIIDSVIGRLSGRDQPDEFPTPDAWRALMAATADYARAQPWVRWPDDVLAEVGITVDGGSNRYLASVIGASGVQRGLNLFPDGRLPALDHRSGAPLMPAGTLIVWLDELSGGDDVAPEFIGKAQRYGWPGELPLMPTYLSFGRQGPADLSNADVRRLTVAVGAVVDQSRRPTAAPVGRARRGNVPVDADAVGTYTLRMVR